MLSNRKKIKDGRNKVEREEIWHEPQAKELLKLRRCRIKFKVLCVVTI